jgi:anti-sigma B factor antagonist
MQIRQQIVDGVTVIALQGDFDAAVAPDVENQVLACATGARARLIVDLSGVPYISSAGLRVLLAAVRAARAGGGDVRLAGLSPMVKRVCDMAGLTKLLSSFASVNEALTDFKS